MKPLAFSTTVQARGVFAVGVAALIASLSAPASATLIAMDDFSGYTQAPTSLNGQAGVPVPLGFTGTWTTPASTTVVGGVLTTAAGDTGRSYRPFATSVTSATGTLSISFVAHIPSAFGGIELAPTANDDTNSIRIVTSGGNIVLQGKNGGSEQNYVLHSIDGLSHTYSIDLDPATQSGQARSDTANWVPFAFTNVGGFALKYLSVADFSGSSLTLDTIAISDAVAVPEPSTYAMALAGLACGGYSVFRRRKRA
ncbi:MAG: PEP-CTERM sorting domain-containing protein [Planctomycetia bacterium]